MTERISLVIYRDGISPEHITVVSADKTQTVDNRNALYERIVRAVTTWMKTSHDGKRAWEYSGDDFNIGDLGSYYDPEEDDPLTRALASEGVKSLTIERLDCSDSWPSYDTPLVDGGDVAAFYDE